MYHPRAIARAQAAVEARFGLTLDRLPVAQCRTNAAALGTLWDPEAGALTRPLTAEEQAFVVSEQLLYQIDFRYAAERYILVNKGGRTLEPLFPLWASQELVLRRLAETERRQIDEGFEDGNFLLTNKARQLGVSTFSQALLCHRYTSQPYVKCLTASDATVSSGNLFQMGELMYRSLPWYLRPQSTKYVTAGEMRTIQLVTESFILMMSGKAMRGQKVEESGEGKGELGRSFTFTGFHLSELSSWENPDQIDDALLPTVPIAPYTFGVFESTADGRHNWWHSKWDGCVAGRTGIHEIQPVFIPWYIEPAKWRLRPPTAWVPAEATLAHARMCEDEGPRWTGAPVSLTKDQLYWYEKARAAAEADEKLAQFLTQYPATPDESFQYSGRSIFSLSVQQRIKAQARRMEEVWLIEPAAMAQERAALVAKGESPL
jgi:hypothetical protein